MRFILTPRFQQNQQAWMGAGLYMDREKQGGPASLLKMEYAPALPSRTLIRRPGFLF